MDIETVEDLANKIADMLGIYGACKHGDCQLKEPPKDGSDDVLFEDWVGAPCKVKREEFCCHGSGCTETDMSCCRVGFMMVFPDRIRQAVENDQKLTAANLQP